jgi:hypothetical protein
MALLQTSHLPPSEASYPKMSSGRIPSVEGGIQPTIFDAKADILTATAADTPARLAVGANNTVLTADSSTATGLKWAAVATPSTSANWSLLNTGGTALTGAQTITVSGITGADKIMVLISDASSATVSSRISLRLNTDTGANYNFVGVRLTAATTYAKGNFIGANLTTTTNYWIGQMANTSASSAVSGYCIISGCNTSGLKMINSAGGGDDSGGGNSQELYFNGGYYSSTSTISSISLFSSTGNFDGGTVYVYTSA